MLTLFVLMVEISYIKYLPSIADKSPGKPRSETMSGYGNKGPGWGRGPGGMPPHLMGVNNDFGGGGMLQQGIPLQQQGMGLAGMAPGMPV